MRFISFDEENPGKAYDSYLMGRLMTYVHPHWWLIALALLLVLAITLAELVRPLILRTAIDDYLIPGDQPLTNLFRLAGLYFLVLTANLALSYGQAYLLQYTGQRIIFDIRQHVFRHLQGMSISFFDRNPVGKLVTQVTNDTETLNEMYTGVLVNLFKDIFMVLGIAVVMLRLDPGLALVSFTGIPLVLAAAQTYRRAAREAFRQVRAKLSQMNAFLQEHISGIRVVQVLGKEGVKEKEFQAINEAHYLAGLRELRAFALFRPSMDLIRSLVLAGLVWYGGGQVIQERVSFGVLYAFINYLEQLFRPIDDLSEKYTIMQSAMASAERIFSLLGQKPEIQDPPDPVHLGRVTGNIEFRNVWFAYNPGEWVLRDISFTIQPGETVALVGATGSGKSSIINLLTRFYDVQQGQVLLDGVDIRRYSLAGLRRQFGLVLQDVFLFAGDVAGNIRLGNTAISDREVEEAARFVNAHSFIRQLPNGYHEPVVERGATLSTGQRQLLAFARALAFNPAILVLDEATANIDSHTEKLIQDALEKLSEGRTTIVVAHRLSTIQRADRIIVLHKGRIREMGTHQQLLDKGGIYHNLYQIQAHGVQVR